MIKVNSTLTIVSVKRIHGKAILMLSNGEALALPRAMLRERPYRSGMPFERTLFDAFLKERAYPFALEKAVRLLASRARTEKEIADELNKNAYPATAIAKVMAKLHQEGYIDDADFAEHWASTRANKGLGCRRIRMELRKKGVAQAEIDEALSAIEEEDALSAAVKVAEKASRGKDLTQIADRQKVLSTLARRGYDFTLAKRALAHIMEQTR